MLGLIVRRAGSSLFTLILISVVVFLGLEMMPGDACTAHLGRDGKGAVLEACRARMGLDAPPVERFTQWAGGMLRGELGTSMQREKPITEIVGWRLRNTLVLSAVAALIGIPLAVLLGILAGLRRDGLFDMAASGTALVAMTIPEFVSATLLILVFAVMLGWLPSFGRGEVVKIGTWTTGLLTAKGWQHIILPAVTLAVVMLPLHLVTKRLMN